ncbi:MAG: DNA replication and repair protein RecF [Polyangiaceae bacterium]
MRSLAVRSLSFRSFRNLARVDLDLGARINVVSGDNGQGKTNLLEGIYVLATSRSFRTSRLADLVQRGADVASLRASIVDGETVREQSVGLRAGVRAVRLDGRRPDTLAEYAVKTPAVVFHPGSMAISSGGGAERRKLLDRLALYLSPSSLADADSYGRAVRARQRVLETRGDAAPDLEDWEDLVVRHGSALSEARALATERMVPALNEAFRRIGPDGASLSARYERSAPDSSEAFRAELRRLRVRDRLRRSATVGPHRDDLSLELGHMKVRGLASQGQHRAVVLSLALAEIQVIAAVRDVLPILLLDDVSSELDRFRTGALFAALRDGRGQVVLTTTRPEIVDLASEAGSAERRDFRVVAGLITPD